MGWLDRFADGVGFFIGLIHFFLFRNSSVNVKALNKRGGFLYRSTYTQTRFKQGGESGGV